MFHRKNSTSIELFRALVSCGLWHARYIEMRPSKKKKVKGNLENYFLLKSSLSKVAKVPHQSWEDGVKLINICRESPTPSTSIRNISMVLRVTMDDGETRNAFKGSHTKFILSRPFFLLLLWLGVWMFRIYEFRDCTTLERIWDLNKTVVSTVCGWSRNSNETKSDESEKISFIFRYVFWVIPHHIRTHLGFNKTHHKQQHISSEIYSE